MCLAVPGKIISIDRSIPEMTMAKVDIRIHKELLDRLIAEKFVKTIYVLNGWM